jgi:hypothetical protein
MDVADLTNAINSEVKAFFCGLVNKHFDNWDLISNSTQYP